MGLPSGLVLVRFGLAGDLTPTGLLLGGLGVYLLLALDLPALSYRYSRG